MVFHKAIYDLICSNISSSSDRALFPQLKKSIASYMLENMLNLLSGLILCRIWNKLTQHLSTRDIQKYEYMVVLNGKLTKEIL